jgi:hypothetical protein
MKGGFYFGKIKLLIWKKICSYFGKQKMGDLQRAWCGIL